jgi:hypothetical protein
MIIMKTQMNLDDFTRVIAEAVQSRGPIIVNYSSSSSRNPSSCFDIRRVYRSGQLRVEDFCQADTLDEARECEQGTLGYLMYNLAKLGDFYSESRNSVEGVSRAVIKLKSATKS